jgi:methenyltetrahydrofolate cyclohydrolase
MNQDYEVLLKILDPEDNSTGGGSASAIAGAMAASLAGMVARLSVGRESMESEAYYREKNSQLVRLSATLLNGSRLDSEAFGDVQQAFRLPKETDGEKEIRRRRIQAAWIKATHIPLDNARYCAETLALAQSLVGRSNKNAASDLTCAIYLARAGGLGCLDNVEINLAMIKDETEASELAGQATLIKERLA